MEVWAVILVVYVIWSFFSSLSGSKEASPFETRLVEANSEEDGSGFELIQIEGRGEIPVASSTKVGIITSIFDSTDGDPEYVISMIDQFQEPETIVYQDAREIGVIEPNQTLVDWSSVGVVIPETLQPPRNGPRKLLIVVRMVNMDNLPVINCGFSAPDSDDSELLWLGEHEFSLNYEGKGYEEAAEHRDESCAISIKIGVAVAMADGTFDDSEGEILKDWIVRNISLYSDEKKEELKKLYNHAMREAHDEAENGDLSLSLLTDRLNEIGDKTQKYDAIELCFDVMAADGVADAEELNVIRKVAEALELDYDEIEQMRDKKLIDLKTDITGQASIEDIIGIDKDWSNADIKKHLRSEFQKWNNRLNTLPEGDERNNAQKMIDTIAEARKKYA